ncbi:MAG: hypothetical protein ACO4AI_09615 [Prochlorothrix sp.]|nr:hypothetical protein [Prochlorothrix sp.]
MLPIVIAEDQVHPIGPRLYLDGYTHRATLYGDQLYRLVKKFSVADRLQAHVLGCKLAGQKIPTLITASSQGYGVWMDFKYPNPMPPDR